MSEGGLTETADLGEVGSGGAALAGYDYQIDVSIWLALDLMLARRLTDKVILEPVSQEDLEATLQDHEPGAVATRTTMDGYELIVQAKRREGDAWTIAALKRLLTHGSDNRKSAAERLKTPRAQYLLVTSAWLNGRTRDLNVRRAGTLLKPASLSLSLAKVLPTGAAGRVAIIGGMDDEKLINEIKRLLTERLGVPYAEWIPCLRELREAARVRIRGGDGGEWRRPDVEAVIARHEGYLAADALMDTYVHPTNWSELKDRMNDRHAALIIGQSGTGKTEATKKLYEELRAEIPGLKRVPIRLGPGQIRDDTTPSPVLYDIEDPWGRVDFDPDKRPWNDQLAGFFSNASGQRMIIATTRRDVIHTAGALKAMTGWLFNLEAEHYGPAERSRLYRARIEQLPHDLQTLATRNEQRVLSELATPLEIQKFFDALRELDRRDPNARNRLVTAAIGQAHEDAIERTVAGQIEQRKDVRAAAVLWGLMKAADRMSLRHLSTIEAAMADRDPAFERGVQPLVDAFVAARNLRLGDGVTSYYHPRVEAGVELALMDARLVARSAMKALVSTLVSADSPDPEWGAGAAARIIAAARSKGALSFKPTDTAAAKIDGWLTRALVDPGADLTANLRLAASAGSAECNAAELARHLLHRPNKEFGFFHQWERPVHDAAWYNRLKIDPTVTTITRRFVREMLPHTQDRYPSGLHDELSKFSDDLTADFMAAAAEVVHWGHIPNDDAIAAGALQDLEGFETIIDTAVAVSTPTDAQRRQWAEESLDIDNGVYSDDYAEHLMDNDDGLTAREMIDAYIHRVRETKGWRYLSQHRHAEALRSRWLGAVGREVKQSELDDEEVAGLFSAAAGTSDEDRFWHIARHAWDERFREPLIARLRQGHDDPDIPQSALACLIAIDPEALGPLAQTLIAEGRSGRLVAIALDLGGMSERNNHLPFGPEPKETHGAAVSRALAALPPAYAAFADAAIAIRADEPAVLPPESLAILAGVSDGELAVRIFKVSASDHYDLPVEDDIRWVLTKAVRDQHAVTAIEAAIRFGMTPEIDAAIDHRFARVGAKALSVIGSAAPVPLPNRFLAKAEERSSFIKRALVALLAARPDPGHVETLVRLTGDQWTSDSRNHDANEDYPIAQAAVDGLALYPSLDVAVLERIYQLAIGSPDPRLRTKVFDIVAAVDDEWRERLFKLANNPGRGDVRRAAAHALLEAHEVVSSTFAARITGEVLRIRGAGIAARLAILFALCVERELVLEMARSLAGNRRRRVLLLLFILALKYREDADAIDGVAELLPAGHIGVELARGAIAGPIEAAAIADLGEATIREEVLGWLNPVPERK